MSPKKYTRRDFLNTLLSGIALGAFMMRCQTSNEQGMPTRPLGETGENVSIISLGGWDIGVDSNTESEAIKIMHEAIAEGLTFFDNCWEYHNGYSEELMGKALAQDNKRDKVFLMTKVCGRDYKTAKKHLEDSLRRLQTDHLDLWQFHGIKWDDDPKLIFDENKGAVRAAMEAKQEGKVRFIGFTGHERPAHHLEMLDQNFSWDTVQMPTNIVDPHFHSFQKQVLPVCTDRNIGVIGMKGLAAQNARLLEEFDVDAETCRRYALSLPISSLVCGIQNRQDLRDNIRIAKNIKPMEEKEIKNLIAQTEEKGEKGFIEEYKTGNYGCDWYHNEIMNV